MIFVFRKRALISPIPSDGTFLFISNSSLLKKKKKAPPIVKRELLTECNLIICVPKKIPSSSWEDKTIAPFYFSSFFQIKYIRKVAMANLPGRKSYQ